MSVVTESLLRRAVSQAASLARQNTRCLYTDHRHARAAEANLMTDVSNRDDLSNQATNKTIMDLPGPDGYPVVGTVPEYFRKENRGQMHEVQRRFHAKYGPIFKEKLGPVTNVSIADSKLIEDIFRSEGKFPKRPPYEAWLLYKEMRKRSQGIVSAYGEEWHKIRTLLNKRLLKQKQAHQHVGELSSISEELVNKLRSVRDQNEKDNTIPDILNVLYAWAIESIGQTIIDVRFGCLRKDMPKTMYDYVKAIEDMFFTSHQLMVFANVHKKFNTKTWKTHVQSWDKILEVSKDILDAKRAEIEERISGSEKEIENATLLEIMLASDNVTSEEIYTNVTELLLSGIDTTSNTVAVAVYLMAKHPHVQKRLQEEADRLKEAGKPTVQHLQNMPYIKAFIKEVLRMYPIVPTNARVMTEDTNISGYIIPKNTIVMLNTFTMCRDSKEFKDPDEFIPERWLRGEVKEFSPFTSLPFGFGSRSCVGRRLAETMIYLTVANIVQNFNIVPVENAVELKPFVRTILTLGDNLPVQFYDR